MSGVTKKFGLWIVVFSYLALQSVLICRAGVFSSSLPLGSGDLDDAVGLSAAKDYTHTYTLNGENVTINGVDFVGTDGTNMTGVVGSFALEGFDSFTSGGSVIGEGSGLNTLLNGFLHRGLPGRITLQNLIPGESYVLTFYNKAWGFSGNRFQWLTSSIGASSIFDVNRGGQPNASLLRYTFSATGSEEWVQFDPFSDGPMHLYGFSNERLFNNAWMEGSIWNTATWQSQTVPDAPGANALLPEQSLPTSIEVNADITLGHLALAGSNPWTINGVGLITLQGDPGGVSVLSATSGSHTISNNFAVADDVVKHGDGKITFCGLVAGSAKWFVERGTIALAESNALESATVMDIASDGQLELLHSST
jgi:hypothetical protein